MYARAAMTDSPELPGFTCQPFSHDGTTRPVYWGGEGPGVVVIHEIPGITPEVAEFGRRVIDAGFTVAMPSLLGTPGRPKSAGYMVASMAKSCVRAEFRVMASGRSSPITTLLRALCREMHTRCGGVGVGAIGMCLTGNFALSLMVEPSMMAPVLSQPSLPFGITPKQRRGLHISTEDLAIAKRRAKEEGVGPLALRFTHDVMVPAARFDRLRAEFGADIETVEIDSGPGNPHGIKRKAHSVVTNDLVDETGHPTQAAFHRVLALFRERLLPEATA